MGACGGGCSTVMKNNSDEEYGTCEIRVMEHYTDKMIPGAGISEGGSLWGNLGGPIWLERMISDLREFDKTEPDGRPYQILLFTDRNSNLKISDFGHTLAGVVSAIHTAQPIHRKVIIWIEIPAFLDRMQKFRDHPDDQNDFQNLYHDSLPSTSQPAASYK
jgi:hypothetical protein